MKRIPLPANKEPYAWSIGIYQLTKVKTINTENSQVTGGNFIFQGSLSLFKCKWPGFGWKQIIHCEGEFSYCVN